MSPCGMRTIPKRERCVVNRSLAVVVALGLGACANTPENLFVPVAQTAPGASSVDMLVATTRRVAANPGELYSGERGTLSFANVVVSIPPDPKREAGEIQWPKTSPGNPATDFVTTSVSRLDSKATRAWLDARGSARNKHRVLIFVHGYNNRFSDAVFRAAQIIHDSGAEVTPILFTWPSRGSVFAYGYDRESANRHRRVCRDQVRYGGRSLSPPRRETATCFFSPIGPHNHPSAPRPECPKQSGNPDHTGQLQAASTTLRLVHL